MSQPELRRRSDRAAFTLMEVLLVLTILVILGSLAVTVYRGIGKAANKQAAQAQVDVLSQACDSYNYAMKTWPTSFQDLRIKPGAQNADDWSGPYLDRDVGLDPWQQTYNYDSAGPHHNGEKPDIWSNGPPGENAPIYNK